MLATQEAQVIPPIWIKHLEIVFVEGSASLSASFSFTADRTGDNDELRTDGDGLLTTEGTNEFVSVNIIGQSDPHVGGKNYLENDNFIF